MEKQADLEIDTDEDAVTFGEAVGRTICQMIVEDWAKIMEAGAEASGSDSGVAKLSIQVTMGGPIAAGEHRITLKIPSKPFIDERDIQIDDPKQGQLFKPEEV